ncbi:capsule polysaccharide transporter [Brucella endophytica]|uniref:Capsule polysaccharide transporter n=1 Tax=Brucella endophytica TaxID=1963359 RepID=A0A916WDD2_9HYPH|nr:polysaccharide biosynthesis/export family protein [Brucella endophytica]GGA88265.1 capsule polysaccharide transporter [Brucella endophytica]
MHKHMAVGFLSVLSACAVPADGPNTTNIRSASIPHTNDRIPIVELKNASPADYNALAYSSASVASGGLAELKQGRAGAALRPGDVIDITIFDTGEEGLFASANSKTLNLGRFTVDRSGSVTLPFVGKKKASGSSVEGLQKQIIEGLRGSTVNPQAVVTVVEKPSSVVTVNGNIRNPGQFPLASGRERVLDVLAQAGGTSAGGEVTVVRGNRRASASVERLMSDTAQNIYLQPGDQVIVSGGSSFTALGAFKSAGEFPFEPGKLTLAQAVARAGGLLDDRADARNLYLFRSNGITDPITKAKNPGAVGRPVIYHINLREVSNFVLMQQFYMRDGDMLFASNAPLANAAKFLTVFQKSVPTAAAPQPSAGGR